MGISVSPVSADIFSGCCDVSGSLRTGCIQPVEVYGFGGRLNVPGDPFALMEPRGTISSLRRCSQTLLSDPRRLLRGSSQMGGHQDLALSLLRTKAPGEILSAHFSKALLGHGQPSCCSEGVYQGCFFSVALGSPEVWPVLTGSCTKLVSHPGGERTQSLAVWL